MDLPVNPPVAPMLAKLTRELPQGGFRYEPKWDGFRCIVFRDGVEVHLGSRNERPLTRYFPEVVDAVLAQLPARCVVDGEIVVAGEGGLDFDALSSGSTPPRRGSRSCHVRRRRRWSPSTCSRSATGICRPEPFDERRRRLEEALSEVRPPVHVTPLTADPAVAADWFARFEGAGLDGVVAKPATGPYVEDQRVMLKVKHERTAEFVVGGFRWYKADRSAVGSLMLGLYDGGRLQHVGVIGSFPAAQRSELVDVLAPYRRPRRPPLGRLGDVGRGRRRPTAAAPRRHEPVERHEGPQLRAAATRARGRGRLRAPAGATAAPHGPVPPLAPRPRRLELHLRPAGGGRPGAAVGRLRGGRRRRPGLTKRRVAQLRPSACVGHRVPRHTEGVRSVASPSPRAPADGAPGTSSGRRQSAVLIPVPAAESLVGPLRRRYDPVAPAGVPAHVTLVVPWVDPDRIARRQVAELAALVAEVGPFDFTLTGVGCFGDPGALAGARAGGAVPAPHPPGRRAVLHPAVGGRVRRGDPASHRRPRDARSGPRPPRPEPHAEAAARVPGGGGLGDGRRRSALDGAGPLAAVMRAVGQPRPSRSARTWNSSAALPGTL